MSGQRHRGDEVAGHARRTPVSVTITGYRRAGNQPATSRSTEM